MDERPVGAAPAPDCATRHEVEPTVPYAIVEAPRQDRFLFYHEAAVARDLHGLWAYCRFCVSSLAWIHDHFEVTPNPRYLVAAPELERRLERVVKVLLNYYRAKALVGSIDQLA